MTIPDLTLEQRTAFAELLASKDQDVLKEMLSLVYDAAIRAQFDEHIGAAPLKRTSDRAICAKAAGRAGSTPGPDRWILTFRGRVIAMLNRRSSSSFTAASAR